ncbi:hypothetical protein L2E82_31780 [Cichorium intybus]|uniref:Uncharacterized protein n=1 Tax=Cichorium intybus TaxID=13427 RepID=A0ACB9BEW4_CICIN|nr:hypothetical protein L2E82_31780 [Cichorium intybus]
MSPGRRFSATHFLAVCDAGLRSALDSEELVDSHHREETRMRGFGFKGWMALSKVVSDEAEVAKSPSRLVRFFSWSLPIVESSVANSNGTHGGTAKYELHLLNGAWHEADWFTAA